MKKTSHELDEIKEKNGKPQKCLSRATIIGSRFVIYSLNLEYFEFIV